MGAIDASTAEKDPKDRSQIRSQAVLFGAGVRGPARRANGGAIWGRASLSEGFGRLMRDQFVGSVASMGGPLGGAANGRPAACPKGIVIKGPTPMRGPDRDTSDEGRRRSERGERYCRGSWPGQVPDQVQPGRSDGLHTIAWEQRLAVARGGWSGRSSAG